MKPASRAWIVAAHPDDEAIGASCVLSGWADVLVIHVTNGAPRDSRWWPAGVTQRHAYRRQREAEAERALAVVGARRIALGIDDQQAVFELAGISAMLACLLERTPPDVIVTHAYEGGHPDHDSVACAVSRACAMACSRALVLEMALYHGAHGTLQVGEHIGESPELRVPLNQTQLAIRRELIAVYESQRATLEPFVPIREERFRVARRYDFSRPPHDGPLHYERVGMQPAPAEWRALACQLTRERVASPVPRP